VLSTCVQSKVKMKRKRGNWDIDDPRSGNSHYPRDRERGRYRGGGGGGYGGHRRNYNNNYGNRERQKPVFSAENREKERKTRIRQLLVRIGEKSSSPLDHTLDQLSTALLSDIDSAREFIVSTLFECVAHLAVKIPIYGTLCGLINHGKEDFGAEITRTLAREMTIALKAKSIEQHGQCNSDDADSDSVPKSIIAEAPNSDGKVIDFNRIRLLFRFAACLYSANVIPISDVLDAIAVLMEQGLSEKVAPFIQEQTAYIVISTFIWTANGHLLKDERENEDIADRVKRMMDVLGEFVRERPNVENPPALKPLKNKPNMDFLTDIWTAFVKMYGECKERESADADGDHNTSGPDEKVEEKKDSQQSATSAEDHEMKKESNASPTSKPMMFEVRSIESPWRTFHRLKKRYSHSLKLKMAEYEVTPWEGIKVEGLLPVWLQFGIPKLLQKKDDGVGDMEKYVVMGYIHDIFEYFSQDTKLCAEQLINLPASFESKYLIVEGIIFKMLTLPYPRHHFIFFGKITIELFRKETKRWPRVVGPLINSLFHDIQNIDTEARDRLIEWFSFHLANFNFQWPWENWSNVCSFPLFTPKTSFIQSVMTRCVHLSYYDRFKATLPKDIISIVPSKPEGNYKYPVNDVANNLVRMLNQRQSAEDIANHLETHIEPMKMDGNKEPPTMRDLQSFAEMKECALSESQDMKMRQIEMLFSCSLHVGKSSCTHLLSFLKLYGKKPLKQLVSQTPKGYGELVVLQCLFEYWSASPVRIEILADKLHAMNYVSPQAIIKFLFLRENLYLLYQQVYWIMTIQAIDRIVKTTQGMKRGIEKFKADLKELNDNLQSDFNDQEATNTTMRTKQKQLDQLTNRLTQTQHKISNVFILYFSECIKSLNHLIAEQDEKKENGTGTESAAAVEDEDDVMEMDDDMLMSEQFVIKQETMEKEKEKLAVKEKQEANVNQYIFNIVLGRMVEIARRFNRQIDDSTWKVLQTEVFANLPTESKQHERISAAVNNIAEIKQLFV